MAILKKISVCLLAVASLTACHETFIPDIDTTPVLCINSHIVAGQPIKVDVSRTWLFSDDEAVPTVADAEVAVYANGTLCDGDYVARQGDRILIEAASATYGEASAEVDVPECVKPSALQWAAEAVRVDTQTFDDGKMNVFVVFNLAATLTIDDPADIANYYNFSYNGYSKSVDYGDEEDTWDPERPSASLWLGTFMYEAEPIFSEHVGVLETVWSGGNTDFSFFTDRQFSGDSYSLHLHFTEMNFCLYKVDFDDELLECGLDLTLATVSQSYYNWANYQWQLECGIIGDMGNVGLSEPLWGYSNVSTGAGVVAAQSHTTLTIDLRDFLRQTIHEHQ